MRCRYYERKEFTAGWKWLLLLFISIISTTKSYKQPHWQPLQCWCCHTCFVNLPLTKRGRALVPSLSSEVNRKPAWSLVMDNSRLQHILVWHVVRNEREGKVCWGTRKAVPATRSYSPWKCLLSAQRKQCGLMVFRIPPSTRWLTWGNLCSPEVPANSAVASSLLHGQSWSTLALHWWPGWAFRSLAERGRGAHLPAPKMHDFEVRWLLNNNFTPRIAEMPHRSLCLTA